MKLILGFLFLLSFNLKLDAQDKHDKKIQKFDVEKFNSLKFENNFDPPDSLIMVLDTLNLKTGDSSDIRVYAPQGNMAPMPNMQIREDVKYTMQIKGYSNKYPYQPKDRSDGATPKIQKPLMKKD